MKKLWDFLKNWRFYIVKFFLSKKTSEYIHYIGSTEVLPPPLREREEYDLISRLAQGDMAVKATLIEHNLRLVVYILPRNLKIQESILKISFQLEPSV
jgi:RNA polymerase sporulation-specific sigma factor